MKSIAEIMHSNRRFDVLGGRTLAENAAYWANRQSSNPEPYDKRESPKKLVEHLRDCAVPDRIADLAARVSTGELEERQVSKVVTQWIEGDDSFLLLAGESGGGKSVAAARMFQAAREVTRWSNGEEARWMPHDCWFLEAPVLSRQSYFDTEGRELVQHIKRVRLLVVDDLGQELISQSYLSTLDEVLCERFADRRKRTALTTNISARRPSADKPSPFEERYGARVARRIRESGTVFHVEAA